jgi:hypothetical protein
MKFVIISNLQLFVLAILVAVLSSIGVSINTWIMDTRLLPEVHIDTTGQCVKVVNFENGHAFNCNDVNVLLRRYRTVKAAS